jgi:hypothetical protein
MDNNVSPNKNNSNNFINKKRKFEDNSSLNIPNKKRKLEEKQNENYIQKRRDILLYI